MSKPPSQFLFRTPEAGAAELVIVTDGKAMAHPLTFDQVRLLAFQATDAVTKWPVVEKGRD